MLFGYMRDADVLYEDDVICHEATLECFSFDRPLYLDSELQVAGALAFATAFGFAGMSLAEWAILQSAESAEARASGGIVELESELFDMVLSAMVDRTHAPSH
jgi:hypothetical protein